MNKNINKFAHFPFHLVVDRNNKQSKQNTNMNIKHKIKNHLLCLSRSRLIFAGMLCQNIYIMLPIFICMLGNQVCHSSVESFIGHTLFEYN